MGRGFQALSPAHLSFFQIRELEPGVTTPQDHSRRLPTSLCRAMPTGTRAAGQQPKSAAGFGPVPPLSREPDFPRPGMRCPPEGTRHPKWFPRPWHVISLMYLSRSLAPGTPCRSYLAQELLGCRSCPPPGAERDKAGARWPAARPATGRVPPLLGEGSDARCLAVSWHAHGVLAQGFDPNAFF